MVFGSFKDLINAEPAARYNVVIERKVQPSPLKYVKTLTVTSPIKITHWFDYESSDPAHAQRFLNTINELERSSSIKGKQITYLMGYSNLTFELWMVLHMLDCHNIIHRDKYLEFINRAFGAKFTELDTYKKRDNFHRILGKISLDNVRAAIQRANGIMQSNASNGLKMHEHRGYSYHIDNPALTIHQSIEKVLKDCGLI